MHRIYDMAPTVKGSGESYDAEISGDSAELTGIPPSFMLDVVGVITALTTAMTGVLLPDGGELVVVGGPDVLSYLLALCVFKKCLLLQNSLLHSSQ